MRKSTTALFLIAVLVLAPAAGFAASPWTTAPTTAEKVTEKFKFGFRNLFLGWTELFTEPQSSCAEKTCALSGIGRGIVNFALDTIGGAAHLGTFFIPQIDIPLPGNGV